MPVGLPKTVLLIDDDLQHLQMYSFIIDRAGFRVVTAVVGRESFSLPEKDHPGLILLDYRLNSCFTSAQVICLLRGTFPGAAIILFSSLSSMPEEMTVLVDGFISKADPEGLVRFVRDFFDGWVNRSQPSRLRDTF